MRSSRIIPLLVCFQICGLFLAPFSVRADVREAMVKIFAVQNRPDYTNPWNMFGPTSLSGSGCVISGNRILTNAHVVSDNTFIQVRLFGQSRKYEARVLAVSHEADLALLTVDEPDFFMGIKPLEIGELAKVQQAVVVYGFPQGGDALSSTTGVVSRIEHQVYAHSMLDLLAVQIDAAINAGSSGGPVLVDDKIIGVAMQYMGNAENIGYMVPVPVINHFLEDLKDHHYDGFPEDGIFCQTMDNDGIRKMYGMKADQSGCLVYRVIPGSPAEGLVVPGDVVMKIDGHQVADDGTVEFRPKERTSMNYYVQAHQLGDEMNLNILRNGRDELVKLKLNLPVGVNQLVPLEQYDVQPTYYIYGGLVFSPLTVNYLKTWGGTWFSNAPKNLVASFQFDQLTQVGEKIVILTRVLPDEVNKGYHNSGDYRIVKMNGQPINNLPDLVRIVEGSSEPFVSFTDRWGASVILDRKDVEARKREILDKYRIEKDRSDDLK
ncbi:MAG TPA: serine protease [Desulfurivibrionaceae bacterium]|nr:serine protease [Desulfurivibrionaceae bacterium]